IKTIFLATSRSPEDHITTILSDLPVPRGDRNSPGTAHPHDFPFLHIVGDRGHRAHLVDGEQEIALLRGRGSDLWVISPAPAMESKANWPTDAGKACSSSGRSKTN